MNLSEIHTTYLTLVRLALWQEEQPIEVMHPDEVLRLCALQGTGPLVFPRLLKSEAFTDIQRVQMKQICGQTMLSQAKLSATLTRVWTAFEEAKIRAVLMKGAGLAALYPQAQMRPWGDIDVYVGPQQYHPACAVMRETFPGALKFDEELDHYKHYNLIADGISIEVHRVTIGLQHPMDERRYAQIESKGMTDTDVLEINGLQVRVPEPTFNALFVFMHAWEHMMTSGANMRQLCDLALLLHHYADRIDVPRLKSYLESLHLLEVWQVFIQILVNGLGLSPSCVLVPSEECGARAERLLKDLLDGKLVQPKPSGKAPKNKIARKLHTMRERLKEADRMRPYSPAYARHLKWTTFLHGASRLFAKDRHWE